MHSGERHLGAMRVVERASEVSKAGGWVLQGTSGWARVHSLLPVGFERYARVFHPAMREADERDLPLGADGLSRSGRPVQRRAHEVPWVEVTWREVAVGNGRVAHPAMEWTSITGEPRYEWRGGQQGLWDEPPEHGSLPRRLTARLAAILASYTGTAQSCWCAAWEGQAGMVGLSSDRSLPRLEMRGRAMILANGPLELVASRSFDDGYVPRALRKAPVAIDPYQSPSLWWPDDRCWCVATDVDLQSTYLGGGVALVERLTSDPLLEVMAIPYDQDLSIDADEINPRPTVARAHTDE